MPRSSFWCFLFLRGTSPFLFLWSFFSGLRSFGSIWPTSASTRSSARSSESELPSTVNGGSKVLNVAYHHGNGEMLHALCGWNGSTATSLPFVVVACLSDTDLAYLSFLCGTHPALRGGGRLGSCGGLHGREGTLSTRRSDALAWVTPISPRVAESFLTILACDETHASWVLECLVDRA